MYALRSLTFTSAVKVALAFKSPFWQRENGPEKNGGKVVTDLSVKEVYYPQKSKLFSPWLSSLWERVVRSWRLCSALESPNECLSRPSVGKLIRLF